MSGLIASTRRTLIIGLGATGLSVARYLTGLGEFVRGVDDDPQRCEAARAAIPGLHCWSAADAPADMVRGISQIALSPGVPRSHPLVCEALAAGVEITNDITLFRAVAKAPVIAITGSNGKSTVTTLVADMARRAGLDVGAGGNLGTPALDLLQPTRDLYVLELSSFQLETIAQLNASVACVLNVSPDHMDRYSNLFAYAQAKQRIYFGAKVIVVNAGEVLTQPPTAAGAQCLSFCARTPDLKQFGLLESDGELHVAEGLTPLIAASQLQLRGQHNLLNAAAALAIAQGAGIDQQAALESLRKFEGLEHRCRLVATRRGVDYIDDSKATNVGATAAALAGLANREGRANIVLLAGGRSKNTDFAPLTESLQTGVKHLVTFGESATAIEAIAPAALQRSRAASMVEAVQIASAKAEAGDTVLLAPACASFDMFENYQARGRAFADAARGLIDG